MGIHIQQPQLNILETKTSDYVVTGNESEGNYTVLVDATSGPVTITLPAPTELTTQFISIKKIDSSANVVTIATPGAELIDGDASKEIQFQNTSVGIQADGSNYYIK